MDGDKRMKRIEMLNDRKIVNEGSQANALKIENDVELISASAQTDGLLIDHTVLAVGRDFGILGSLVQ